MMCDSDEEEPCCCCCWEPLSPPIVTLKCKHRFHLACINEWGKRSSACPMCRDQFKPEIAPPTEEEQQISDFLMMDHLDFDMADPDHLFWWQYALQFLAVLSGSITMIRFISILCPYAIENLFKVQIETGKHLSAYFTKGWLLIKPFLSYIILAISMCHLE